jgi:hypothetical protein
MTDIEDKRPEFYKDRSAIVEAHLLALSTAQRLLHNAFELVIDSPMTQKFTHHRAAKPIHAICNALRAFSTAAHSHQPQTALSTLRDALSHIYDTDQEAAQ